MNAPKAMTIKKVAVQAGVGIETIRFYEREALISEPPRTPSGYRQYSPGAVARIKFIKRVQSLGFSLPEIKDLMALKMKKTARRQDLRQKAEKKIAEIEAKIQSLQKIKETLKQMTQTCHGEGPLSECPILKAFEAEDRARKKD
jgi:MerR family transcriptional regulator, copper efflux regulator